MSTADAVCVALVLVMMTYNANAASWLDKLLLLSVGASMGVGSTLLCLRYKFYVHYGWWRTSCWVRHHWPCLTQPAVIERPTTGRRTMTPPQ
jgi:hypothetical protein